MDQRVDSERRTESGPDQEGNADGPAAAGRSVRGTLRKRLGLILLIAVLAVAAGIAGVLWWLHARQYESTDDAFIDARTIQISSQIGAAIVDVPVTDNQFVEAGTVLVRLDDRDSKVQLDQAKAQIAQAQAGVANLDAQLVAQKARIDQAEKQVAQAQAALTFAKQQSERYQQLAKQGSATVEQSQQYSSNLLQSEASLAAAQANAIAADKQNGVLEAQRKLADAQVSQARATAEQAEVNLSRAAITAPIAGRTTKLSAAAGGYAAVGQALMMFVPREVWVTANFKETQLDLMRPGQPVDITIDAYPDRTFKGHIDSIQSGSGTAFSLLPAENATGNYVKIVQRVPVKIVFNQPPDVELGPGMSAVPTVKVR
jgi:membrane fusion protein (multidrug efflux system)